MLESLIKAKFRWDGHVERKEDMLLAKAHLHERLTLGPEHSLYQCQT